MADKPTRTYTSPLRDLQARQTQGQILDSLTELLSEKRVDEVTTREIATRAGVSQPTVYRYFPDRQALLEGLVARLSEKTGSPERQRTFEVLDDFGPMVEAMFHASDAHAIEATAEALLNADPRRFSDDTRAHSDRLRRAIDDELPSLSEHERVRLGALLRSLGSAQTWLRMREEFGLASSESGPLVAWAIATLLREATTGRMPPLADTS